MKKTVIFMALMLSNIALGGGYGTKYIATGWDIGRATPEQILARADQFDKLSIDGVSMKIDAEQDGVKLDSGYIWGDPKWRYETFAPQVAVFRKIVSHRSLRLSFLGCGMSARRTEQGRASLGGKNPRIKLSDDAAWERIAHNYAVLAKIAKSGALRGLLIDNEDYHGTRQFQWHEEDGTWQEANEKMRARGRQVFSAIFREFPDAHLLFYWAFSNARLQSEASDPKLALKESKRLFPAFLNGMLDVMPPEAVFIDGDEDSYTFRAANGSFNSAFLQILKGVLQFVAPEHRAKYRAQVRNSFGLYLDQYVGAKYRRRAGKRGVPNNWYRAPVDGSRDAAFRADLEAAVRASDEYVWIYGERFSMIDWGNDLDGKMEPWNSFMARQTWDEHLGFDTKLRLAKDQDSFLKRELARLRSDPSSENLLSKVKPIRHPSVTSIITSEQITNRNIFAVSIEMREGATAPILRWQRGTAWNWEKSGVRKVELRPEEGVEGNWRKYSALLRVPEGANRFHLQIAKDAEFRNAALYRLDAPPKRPFQLGYQLDIARGKVPTMPSLKRIVDIISRLGYTQFQLYMECAFAYKGHEKAWNGRSPMTPAEMRELYEYCKSRGIELVPSQNSFAHMERWFEVDEYRRKLAECPSGAVIDTPKMKKRRGPVTLVASGGESLSFLRGLYDQLLPTCPGRYLNIGCDEVYDLWDKNCRSAAKVAKDGYARTYIDHVLAVRTLAYMRQRESMFWADAIFEYPELIREIPKDMIALVYGYTGGGNDKFEEKVMKLEADEVRFYVCPGTSGWCGPSGRTRNMMENIKEAFTAGSRHGAEGLLLCDWGDLGHHQPWLVALPSLVYASALVKGRELTRKELAEEIDKIAGAQIGVALLEAGDVWEKTPDTRFLHRCYAAKKREIIPAGALAVWRQARSKADLKNAPEWIRDDFATIDFLYRLMEANAQGRSLNPEKLEKIYRKLWEKQNRPGGFVESLEYLKGAK